MLPVATVLARGRAHAARLMTDTCTIQRVTGRVFNETTGAYAITYSSIYDGPCRVKTLATGDLVVDAGDRQATVEGYQVSIPMSSTMPAVEDVVTITASTYDAGQVGLTLTVVGIPHGAQTTARRLRCQEVTS